MNEKERENLIEAYTYAFKNNSEDDFKKAIFDYADNEDYFPPSPKAIRKHFRESSDAKNDKYLQNRFTCLRCKQKVSAITGGNETGICLDCAGFPTRTDEPLVMPEPDKEDFKIEGRIQCQECGKVGQCIKDPIDTGKWQCKDCYSGLTKQQRKQRFSDLIRMMADKSFKPDWVEDLSDVPF